MPAWLSYTLLRLGLFVVAFALLLVLGLYWLWSALIATVVAFCVSYIFFRRQRLALAEQWATRQPARTRDDEAEDSELERDGSAANGSARNGERERGAES